MRVSYDAAGFSAETLHRNTDEDGSIVIFYPGGASFSQV